MSLSFQGATLFTLFGWSDRQAEGLTEMFVEADSKHLRLCVCGNSSSERSAGSLRRQVLDLEQHGVLLRPQLVSGLQAAHQV